MKNRRDGFTLVEIIVTVAIILTLCFVTAVVSSSARESARTTLCVFNLRQWGLALNLYATDHDGSIPRRGQGVQPVWNISRPEDWFNCLPPYFGQEPYSTQAREGNVAKPGNRGALICPTAKRAKGDTNPHFLCYGMNMYLSPWIRPQPHRLIELENLSQLAFMADAPGGWASTVPSRFGYGVQARHAGKANVVFVDGHVASFTGTYLGCGVGEPSRPEIRWQTLSDGINQTPAP